MSIVGDHSIALQSAAVELARPLGIAPRYVIVEGVGGRFQVEVTRPAADSTTAPETRGSLRLGCRFLSAHAERHGSDLPLLPAIKNAAAVSAYDLSDNGELNATLRVLREFGIIGTD